MAMLTIPNFDDDLNQLLQVVATRRGHSIEEEVRDILQSALTRLTAEIRKKEQPTGERLSNRFKHIDCKLDLHTRSQPRDLSL